MYVDLLSSPKGLTRLFYRVFSLTIDTLEEENSGRKADHVVCNHGVLGYSSPMEIGMRSAMPVSTERTCAPV